MASSFRLARDPTVAWASRSLTPAPDERARRFMAVLLAACQAVNMTAMPMPIIILGLTMLAASLYLGRLQGRNLLRLVLLAMTLLTALLTWQHYGRLFGRDPGVALLFVLGPLKLAESRSARDFMVVWGMALVLYVASFFENLGLGAALTLPVVVVMFVTALRLIERPAQAAGGATEAVPLRAHLQAAARDTLLGIPLAALLFILFPRATAPLWGMRDPQAAETGLSEQMRPGQIAQLILSREPAFRAEFVGRTPRREQLYWRGPVLRAFDGETWRALPELDDPRLLGQRISSQANLISFSPEEHAREAIEYTVTIERADTRWLPVLELPIALPRGPAVERVAYATDAQQIALQRRPTSAFQYRLPSLPRDRYPASEPVARIDLGLGPPASNPQARALAAELARLHPDPAARVQALLARFRNEPFYYTLNPPRYGIANRLTGIDEFLFEERGRRGFCEHYAGAFVFVMRASGIPARVVTGYMGGELQPAGHWLIRQSDAHAWAEVLIGGEWRRIDPTAAVAPERIERSLDEALPETERLLLTGRRWFGGALFERWWEEANFAYTRWVIGFDRDRQRELLRKLGMPSTDILSLIGWMLLAISVLGAASAGLWWWLAQRAQQARDPVLRQWQLLRAHLQKAGLALPAHWTVRQALLAASTRWPEHRALFMSFAERYYAARFAAVHDGPHSAQELARLRRCVPSVRRLRRKTQAEVLPTAESTPS